MLFNPVKIVESTFGKTDLKNTKSKINIICLCFLVLENVAGI
jgi:hypothetical protein